MKTEGTNRKQITECQASKDINIYIKYLNTTMKSRHCRMDNKTRPKHVVSVRNPI